jgi:hypothetical protein
MWRDGLNFTEISKIGISASNVKAFLIKGYFNTKRLFPIKFLQGTGENIWFMVGTFLSALNINIKGF